MCLFEHWNRLLRRECVFSQPWTATNNSAVSKVPIANFKMQLISLLFQRAPVLLTGKIQTEMPSKVSVTEKKNPM